jgi:predicted PurR-regulated permease PerM
MNNSSKTFHSGRAIFSLMIIICCILVGAVLKIASTVILPFTISILLAFVMYPLVKSLDKFKFPRFASILLIVIVMVTILYFLGIVLYTSGKAVYSSYPKYEARLTEIYIWASRLFELSYNESLSFWDNIWGQLGIRTFILNSTGSIASFTLKFAQNAGLVILFMVFILLEASYFKEKLDVAFEKRSERINRMGHDLMTQVTRYLAAKFVISLVNGVVFIIAFSLVGLEFAVVWGLIQFFLNFIPALGSIVAGVLMSLFALVQFWPNPAPIIIVVAIVLGTNIILGNILDPKIIGEHVGISPLMILVSLAVWGYIWGFAGMVLAVPMSVIIKIVCENIPIMEPVSILIGSRRSVQAKKAENEKIEA